MWIASKVLVYSNKSKSFIFFWTLCMLHMYLDRSTIVWRLIIYNNICNKYVYIVQQCSFCVYICECHCTDSRRGNKIPNGVYICILISKISKCILISKISKHTNMCRYASACGTKIKVRLCVRRTRKFLATQLLCRYL